MLSWVNKCLPTLWTRRTRWTPLLQSQREFQRTLRKERSRVERDHGTFGLIVLRLSEPHLPRPQTVDLAKILHRRLRDTDEKGHLGLGRLGVMLPASGIEASESVLADLLFLAAQRGIKLHGEAFVYPESEERGTRTRVSEKTLHATSRSPSVPLALMVADYPRWKRALDVSGALAGLMLAFPVFVIVAVLIKLTSRGPIFFCQDRTGYLGRPFTIIKFRSMVDNAEELKAHLTSLNERDGPAFKMRRDPRITRFGSFLRCTGLDELPQLINVIRGDMSLVGPRPLPIQEAEQCLTWQKQRQEVKPGLTCYWQLAKSRQVAFTDWMRLDLQYARRLSFRLDLQLIFRTFSAIFLGKVGH